MSQSVWTIEMLGPLCISRGGQRISHFRTHKTSALLACLACRSHCSLRREELIELLWPDNNLESGRNSLRISLSALRQLLEPSPEEEGRVVVADRMHVYLNPAAYITDKDLFERKIHLAAHVQEDLERAALLKEAASVYKEDLLPGFDEPWILGERQRLADAHLLALRRLVKLLVKINDSQGALEYARRAVQADPFREEAHRAVMQLYAALGQPAMALKQYQELTGLLQEELGLEPCAATRKLAAQLVKMTDQTNKTTDRANRSKGKTVTITASASSEPKGSPSDTSAPVAPRRDSLPRPLTRFFGREDSLAAVVEMLNTPDTRLITLTGLGGSGKTRLALAVAERMLEPFDGAVWFVPLAQLCDAQHLPDAILAALQLPRQPNKSALEQALVSLAYRPALLVLDNFEHLAEQGTQILATLLAQAPALTCLITSRQRLNLTGEYEYGVHPLPTPQTPGTPDRLLEFASVQLFVDRARSVRPAFEITANNASAIAALCHHLEGVPLSLELAAAYAQILTPSQILARLSPRLALLVNRAHDAPPRHASLRAALEWSFHLLCPPLQRCLARLSVFRGGCSLEAAEAVCGADAGAGCRVSGIGEEREGEKGRGGEGEKNEGTGNREQGTEHPKSAIENRKAKSGNTRYPIPGCSDPRPPTPDTLECLLQLRERSLLCGEERGSEMRFVLLETVREFAAEQLEQRGEREEAAAAHAGFYLQQAEQASPGLFGAEAVRLLEGLEIEQANLRAALAWSLAKAEGEKGRKGEGETIQPSSFLLPPSETGLRLVGALWPWWYVRGYYEEGMSWLERALQGGGKEAGAGLRDEALRGAGNIAYSRRDYERARFWFEQRLALARERGDERGIAASLGSLGNIANDEGDFDTAQGLLTEALMLFRKLEDQRGLSLTLANLSSLTCLRGDYQQARALHEESLALFRAAGDRENIAIALTNLAHLCLQVRDMTVAGALLIESLHLAQDMNNKRILMHGLANSITLCIRQQALLQAAVLFGATQTLCVRMEITLTIQALTEYERERSEVQAALGEREFDAAFQQGQAMSLEQATDYALQQIETIGNSLVTAGEKS